MKEKLSPAQYQRLQTLWDVAQTDKQYRGMLSQIREQEKMYEKALNKLSREDSDAVRDFVSLCEGMNWRILEIAAQRMVFRFEKEK